VKQFAAVAYLLPRFLTLSVASEIDRLLPLGVHVRVMFFSRPSGAG
jgi:hypothetical protein